MRKKKITRRRVEKELDRTIRELKMMAAQIRTINKDLQAL